MRIGIAVAEVQVAAAKAALEVVSGRFRGLFTAIATADTYSPTEVDAAGNFRGTIWGRVIWGIVDEGERRRLKSTLDAAGITYHLHETRETAGEDLPMGFLSTYGLRSPGHKLEAYGTLKADGTAPAQTIGTGGTVIDQWTSSDKVIQMTKILAQNAVDVVLRGEYLLDVRIHFIEVPGVTWTFQGVVNQIPTGRTLVTSTSPAVGERSLGVLAAGDRIKTAIAADKTGQRFALLKDSKSRVRMVM